MEKKSEYIDRLLQTLQNLEARVSSVRQEESVPFSFFRDAFQKGQDILKQLHELEMLQIEDMKRQMEKLVLFLSEAENRKPEQELPPVEFEEISLELPENDDVPDIQEQEFSEETEKIVEEEKIIRRNVYAEGLTLPTYVNPRNAEVKAISQTPAVADPVLPVLSMEEKPVIRSVNDIIQTPPSKLDVKRSLSLNDRFYYQRELFDNDREAMNSMMIRLNAFDNYEDTERYLSEHTSWDFKDEKVKNFLELLKKGFE